MSDFSMSLKSFADKTEGELRVVIQKVALEILSRLVMRTPVGNPDLWKSAGAPTGYTGGQARGNWQVTIGAEAIGELERIDPGGNATIAEGTAIISSWLAANSIFIVNNVPYIARLEDGWSTQAPEGMLRITIAEFDGIVQGAVRQL
jgi:hypothetical protein